MITGRQYLHRTLLAVFCFSCLFTLLGVADIPFQLYLWELFIDSRILVLIGLLVFLLYRRRLDLIPLARQLLQFRWRQHVVFFLMIPVIYLISSAVGLITSDTVFKLIDNAVTVILGMLFDIPAVYVFSATTILVEELFFRGILLESLRSVYSDIQSIVAASLLWLIFSLPEIATINNFTAGAAGVLAIYYFSIGLLSATAVLQSGSVWISYSFRVGIVMFTPLAVSSLLIESDPFFATSSLWFMAEGLITSILFFGLAFVLSRKIAQDKEFSIV